MTINRREFIEGAGLVAGSIAVTGALETAPARPRCSLHLARPACAYGPCPLFPGKAVNSKGWCSAYAKAA